MIYVDISYWPLNLGKQKKLINNGEFKKSELVFAWISWVSNKLMCDFFKS